MFRCIAPLIALLSLAAARAVDSITAHGASEGDGVLLVRGQQRLQSLALFAFEQMASRLDATVSTRLGVSAALRKAV